MFGSAFGTHEEFSLGHEARYRKEQEHPLVVLIRIAAVLDL